MLLIRYNPTSGKYTVRQADDQSRIVGEGDCLYDAIDDLESELPVQSLAQELRVKRTQVVGSIHNEEEMIVSQ